LQKVEADKSDFVVVNHNQSQVIHVAFREAEN